MVEMAWSDLREDIGNHNSLENREIGRVCLIQSRPGGSFSESREFSRGYPRAFWTVLCDGKLSLEGV
jgi:hypothetical protein